METGFHEGLHSKPIRDLHLEIGGTRLEPIIEEFREELRRAHITLEPHVYLSTEWGVPFDTVSIAIPFYLARPELSELHADRYGHVEGVNREDILRYLRHEMGHVVNYAWRLYEQPEWVLHFGSITQPYIEEYQPEPFSRRFVRHLPGWYAQKHPDEDWAETFAVWMTPGRDWRAEYDDWPEALAKLELCDRTMAALQKRKPINTKTDLDEDVADLDYTLEDFYEENAPGPVEFPRGLDGALRAIFEDHDRPEDSPATVPRFRASELIHRHERVIVSNVFRWTGHFPERTRPLLRHLATRADVLEQVYPGDREPMLAIALTTLVTALAMNWVRHGSYLP